MSFVAQGARSETVLLFTCGVAAPQWVPGYSLPWQQKKKAGRAQIIPLLSKDIPIEPIGYRQVSKSNCR